MLKRKDDDTDLPGVCHRFFNWVLTRFLGFRCQPPSPRLPPASSTEVPVEYINNISIGGDDKSTDADHLAQPVVPLQMEPAGGATVVSGEKSGEQPKAGKGRQAATTTTTTGTAGHQEAVKPEIIRPWPGLTLVTNINEISDDYIRKRKAAMQRTNTTKPPPTGVF